MRLHLYWKCNAAHQRNLDTADQRRNQKIFLFFLCPLLVLSLCIAPYECSELFFYFWDCSLLVWILEIIGLILKTPFQLANIYLLDLFPNWVVDRGAWLVSGCLQNCYPGLMNDTTLFLYHLFYNVWNWNTDEMDVLRTAGHEILSFTLIFCFILSNITDIYIHNITIICALERCWGQSLFHNHGK